MKIQELNGTASVRPAKKERVNILLVDDHADSLFAMQVALESLGQNLIQCQTGEQALREALKREFAVIVLDVRLPGMDGFDIAATIRERPSSANTPIIFLTGMNKEEPQVTRGYSLGAVDYLIKPIDPHILRSKVRVFVDLFKKTEEVRRQTEQIYLLREREREQAQERERLAVERRILDQERSAAEALGRKAAELERSNAELRQFAYIASHDLQEPLRTITSFCGLLRNECEGQINPAADEYIRFITQAATRMSSLIKAMLEHSRIGQTGRSTRVDCSAVIRDVLSDLKASISESGAEVEVGPLPWLTGDESDFRLLFQNLVSNAVKFRVRDRTPRIRISARRRKHEWRFSVEDNGIGIEKQHDRRIFDIFQRVRPQDEYEGTGIGLAHCRKIVELYGGRIWVESEPGKGSTFHFSIPA